MLRGIVTGLVYGFALALPVLAVMSLVAPPPVPNLPVPQAQMDGAAGGGSGADGDATGVDLAVVVPPADARPSAGRPQQVAVPAVPQTDAGLTGTDPQGVPAADTRSGDGLAAAPATVPEPGATAGISPVLTAPETVEPRQPGADFAPGADTTPPAGPAPQPQVSDAGLAAPDAPPVDGLPVPPRMAAAGAPAAAPGLPSAPDAPANAPATALGPQDAPAAPQASAGIRPQGAVAPGALAGALPSALVDPAPGTVPGAPLPAATPGGDAPPAAGASPHPASRPTPEPAPLPSVRQIGQNERKLPGEQVGRFQTLSERQAAAALEAAETSASAPGAPAIVAYGRDFDNPKALPLMAVVLIDEGGPGLAATDLASLPFALSFAIDATRADAAQAMQSYRQAGMEVLAMPQLPAGGQPGDIATALDAALRAVPQAVAVMEPAEQAFQGDRQLAAQVAGQVGLAGLGLVTWKAGLNSVHQIAGRDKVPAAQVFRDIDGAGQDRAAIRRFLDQAAFRAGIDGGVIVVGHARAETLAALAEWSLGNRAATVALAPVTAILLNR